MAEIVRTYTNDEGHEINVYESGAEYDMVAKRLTKPADGTVITTERATLLNRRSMEKKRERARIGANAALRRMIDKETGEPAWENPQDMDFIEAITKAQAVEALNGGAYASKAAEFVVRVTGYDERTQSDPPSLGQAAEVLTATAELVRLLRDAVQPVNVIDAIPVKVIQLHDTETGEND